MRLRREKKRSTRKKKEKNKFTKKTVMRSKL